MDLKTLFTKVLEEVVFPMVDEMIRRWASTDQLLAFWAAIRDLLRKHLESVNEIHGLWDAQPGPFPIKALIISFVETVVFPVIDSYVASVHTPFEWDDKVWALLKVQIRKYLDGMTFNVIGAGKFSFGGSISKPE